MGVVLISSRLSSVGTQGEMPRPPRGFVGHHGGCWRRRRQGKRYGANRCKGTGGCGSAHHACTGKDAGKGQGSVKTDSNEACRKMEGGRLTSPVRRAPGS